MHIRYMVFSTSDGFIGTWPHGKSRKICNLMYNNSCHLWSMSSGSGTVLIALTYHLMFFFIMALYGRFYLHFRDKRINLERQGN